MPMVLLHLDLYSEDFKLDPRMSEVRFSVKDEMVADLLKDGRYVAVALVEGDEVEDAWSKTQNGAGTDSWSRRPLDGVTPLGTGTLSLSGGAYGYKSSDLGDVVLKDGEVHVVAAVGFRQVDAEAPDPAKIRVIGTSSIMLADALAEKAAPAPR